MLAYELACGSGILDVEAWRDSIPPEVFDRWVAFNHAKGNPLDRIAAILKLGFAALCNSWGGSSIKPEDFEPDREKTKAAEKIAGPDETVNILRAALGGK